MELRQFNLRKTTWSQSKNQILGLRRAVTISLSDELTKDLEIKSDEEDSIAYHWLALDSENIAIGAIRLLPS